MKETVESKSKQLEDKSNKLKQVSVTLEKKVEALAERDKLFNVCDSVIIANRMESTEEVCSPPPVESTVSSDDSDSNGESDTDISEHLKDNLELTTEVEETATEQNTEKTKLEGQILELDSIIKELDTIEDNVEIEENVVECEENEKVEYRHDSEHQIEVSQDILDHNKRFFDGFESESETDSEDEQEPTVDAESENCLEVERGATVELSLDENVEKIVDIEKLEMSLLNKGEDSGEAAEGSASDIESDHEEKAEHGMRVSKGKSLQMTDDPIVGSDSDSDQDDVEESNDDIVAAPSCYQDLV